MENPQGLMARSQYDVTQVSSTKSCNSLIKEFVIRTIYVGNFPMKTMQAGGVGDDFERVPVQ
jgi:hypothetical protein